jgi:hypothetical protein
MTICVNGFSMDLFRASLSTEEPDYGLCSSYRVCLESEFPILRQGYRELTTVAFSFPVFELEDSFQSLLWDMRWYLEMIDSYGKGSYATRQQKPLALYRNIIQHRLLGVDSDVTKPVREICRVAVLLFSSVVVYPLQNSKPMLQYLNALTTHLKSGTLMDNGFRIWLLMLGGMAADESPLQSWYISQLGDYLPIHSKSWSSVKELLREYLWLDSACGEGGLELWLQVRLARQGTYQ